MAPVSGSSKTSPMSAKEIKPESKRTTSIALLLMALAAVLFCGDAALKHAGYNWRDAEFDLQRFTRLGPHREFPSSLRANFLLPKSTDHFTGEYQAAQGNSRSSFRHQVLGAGVQKAESEDLMQPDYGHECPVKTPSVAAFSPTKLAPHVSISGSGRGECTVGEVCAFRITATTDTYWNTDDPANREIFFTYKGSSLGVGDLAVEYGSIHPAWTATYIIWDQGNYTFTVRADCNSVLESTVLAEFSVTIHQPQAQSQGSNFDAGEESRTLAENPPKDSPCDRGASGRWFLKESGRKPVYSWTPYNCAPSLIEPGSFVKRLNDAGYKRLTFIGDSHQRVLYMHLKYLLAGHADASERRQHGDMSLTIEEGDSRLELRYYWVDGIYQNHEFGCHNRGMYSGRNDSFPDVEPGPGIYIFDAGTWTTASCAQPQLAYAKHLPGYLEWAAKFDQEGSKLVWRTTPSWRGACNRKNAVLAWTNRYAVPMVTARKEFQIFNSWEVEAPRYGDLCDWHYSCLKSDKDKMVMKGDVGEAVARSLMTWLVKKMR